MVIDDDPGRSGANAEGRPGFQRLVAEVSLGHVGIIIGIEMSRLAHSCRDWRQLLEVCSLFRTLIADTEGAYDPGHSNDRLLLGLKGSLSEAELHVIKQRVRGGLQKGELQWRRPNRVTLSNLLHNPAYAGAYVYGRRPTDPRMKKPGRPSTGRVTARQEDWEVLIKDKLPAYISWEDYERNQRQLHMNSARGIGTPPAWPVTAFWPHYLWPVRVEDGNHVFQPGRQVALLLQQDGR